MPLRVIGGLEEAFVVGTENQLSIFRDRCEKIDMPILTYIKEDKFHEIISKLVSSVSIDITITRGLKIYKEFLDFISKISKDPKKSKFISAISKHGILTMNKKERTNKIRELSERYGLTYRLGRDLVSRMRRVSLSVGQNILRQILKESKGMLQKIKTEEKTERDTVWR